LKQSVYLETTIPSYLAARTSSNIIIAGKQAATHEFFEKEQYKYNLYVSRFVLQECANGDVNVAKRRMEWLNGIAVLPDTPDIERLADTYMGILSIPLRSRIDTQHLAMCCIHEIDILLSWNCTHLGVASMQKIQGYNDAHGLHTPQMTTPHSLVKKILEVDD